MTLPHENTYSSQNDQEEIIRKETAIASQFILSQNVRGHYSFTLHAPNGQLLLTSPSFTDKDTALQGINLTRYRARHNENFEVCGTEDGKFYMLLKDKKGMVLGQSKIFDDLESLEKGMNSIKGCVRGTRFQDQTLLSEAAFSSKNSKLSKSIRKGTVTFPRIILIQNVTSQFSFTIRTSDGQLLLTSPFFTDKDTALRTIALTRSQARSDVSYQIRSAGGGQYYFELKNDKGEMLGRSTVYANGEILKKGINSLKNCSKEGKLLDLTKSE